MDDQTLLIVLGVFMLGDATLAAYFAWRRVRAGFHDPAFWEVTLAAAVGATANFNAEVRGKISGLLRGLLMGEAGGGGGIQRTPSFKQMLQMGLLNWLSKGKLGAYMGLGGAMPGAGEAEPTPAETADTPVAKASARYRLLRKK